MKDEIEQNSGDSSRILYDITLNLADSTGVDDGSYPTSSRDIYVIDPPTGQPRRRHTHKQNSV